jgi:hypothetical protein
MRQTLAESFGKACKSRNILNARRAFRVAAPSIRIVPWAALASCWPLPQQLLPVSATGGGRRRCSGKIIFYSQFRKIGRFSGIAFSPGTLRGLFCTQKGCRTACVRQPEIYQVMLGVVGV